MLSEKGRKGKRIVSRRTDPKKPAEYGMTIEQAFDYFVTLKKTEGLRPRTMEDYPVLFEYFTEWLAEAYPDVTYIDDITTGMIREYSVYLSEERFNDKTGGYGLSPYTVNIRIRFLKVFFRALFTEELIDKDPAANVKLMRVDEDTFEPLTDKEILKLLDAPDVREYAQFRDKVAMSLILDTGMRVNEVFSLEVSEIDFKTRSIMLPASKNKNRKPRIIPLSNTVLKLLLELITENKVHFDSEYVFLSNFGERYNSNSFRSRLRIYKDLAGIEKRVSPHALRHQFCRDYIMNGGDIFTLQRIVGHADIQTTRKYVQMTGVDIQSQHSLYSPIVRLRNKHR
ncbi:tyrosine-type recombinase/integrase [Siminovitchia thermophila]|uniref:tyrosine-type recombinase/integrase n=1 Tax=Siminovitchia thermophila TaxID=1245522 RepID=UPI001965C480|nr:tyrosine-type recombinase/integrase [Siminovitchia thermophila]